MIELLFLVVFAICFILLLRKYVPIWQIIIAEFYFVTFLLFLLFSGEEHPYYEAIDPAGLESYEFVASKHRLIYMIFFVLYHISLLLLWFRKSALPPLILALGLCVLYIGLFFNGILILQLLGSQEGNEILVCFPIFSLLVGLSIIIRTLYNLPKNLSFSPSKHQWLNKINEKLSTNSALFCSSVIAILPIFVLITLILMLFGDDYDAVSKALTETTTWGFSQHNHPPHLPHQGHYLCTVAAFGSPQLVKPLRWGIRGKQRIIVNRQLQIANAFEELIADLSPTLHRFIRKNYDRYGYDLSKKIKSRWASNLTYILMKPLEWGFLLCLYTFCLRPEEKIRRQYSLQLIINNGQITMKRLEDRV